MLRSKILGQDHFTKSPAIASPPSNADIGHFSIGSIDYTGNIFEDVPIPPKHLWIRAKVAFIPCPDTPVFQSAGNFVWQGSSRCKAVTLTPLQILYAQKDYQVDKCWTISPDQTTYIHEFATAPSMYDLQSGIHLWPCGGSMNSDITKIEQLFAQVPIQGERVYVNSLSTWENYLIGRDSQIIFEPPTFNSLSLSAALTAGKFNTRIEQSGLEYCFSSCRFENTQNPEYLDILCERKEQ